MPKKENKKDLFDFKDVINWAIAAVGVLAAFLGAMTSPKESFSTALISSLAMQIVLCTLFSWHLIALRRKNKEIEDKSNENITQYNNLIDLKRTLQDEQEENSAVLNNVRNQIGEMTLNLQYACKLYNELCAKIEEISKESDEIMKMIQKSGTAEVIDEENLDYVINKYSDELYGVYKRYTSNLLKNCYGIENAYLRTKDLDHRVSITLKLFNKPYSPSKDDRSDIIVYTAFRDSKAYEAQEREIGKVKYSIDKNTAYTQCLTSNSFIINNVKKNNGNYKNEHIDFDQYYNCAVVVPIKTEISEGEYVYYGYLCCDCYNDDPTVDNLMDDNVARILTSTSQLYTSFIRILNLNWNNKVKGMKNRLQSFLTVIYDKTFHKI